MGLWELTAEVDQSQEADRDYSMLWEGAIPHQDRGASTDILKISIQL